MHGRRRGEESPHGERQMTEVPVARRDSYVETTIRPVIDCDVLVTCLVRGKFVYPGEFSHNPGCFFLIFFLD